ncbi:transporter substrate-binding domain-containing protein [Vibrio europaeus]|uniref:substrate-binding periplasmic protein n=1 Tax=Vibrio europaeus TaxID=300876 RepID=UPI00233F3F21|nr:transporter substrate-binding domain-containing protein [Vibrio europaeus]MDC5821714.1 transporter substrate-binding domain-containing protein [Vibrio europaeus]MDC5868710.1 transporter substrate-binding domain-containing protein [Vibrio europaeus]
MLSSALKSLLVSLLGLSSSVWSSEVVRVCGVDWPPFSFVDDNSKVIKRGISVEIYREAFSRMGKKVEFHHVPWGRCEKHVLSGKYDAILDSVKVAGLINTSIPTAFYPLGAYVNKDSQLTEFSWERVDNQRVGLVINYHYADIILSNKDWKVVPAETEEKLLTLLGKERVDFAIMDYFSVVKLSEKVGIETRLLQPLIVSQNLYLCFNPKHNNLITRLEIKIKEMLEDGSIDALYKRYSIKTYSEIYNEVKSITEPD